MKSAPLLVVLLLSVALPSYTQSQSQPASNSASQNPRTPPEKTTDQKAAPAKPLTPAEQRQAQIEADTAKLYQLTQELKAEVAKSNKDTLSVEVIKKADEIEKLARSLKERMRTAH
jgi:hypothetical protein